MAGNDASPRTLFGFRITADASWVFLALFIAWTLADGLFPLLAPELERSLYWLMAACGVAGLMGSLILHELGHAVVARHYGMEVYGIRLFLFGGVAETDGEPPTPGAEVLIAVAGPAVSGLLALLFYLTHGALTAVGAPIGIATIALYLAWLNTMLLVFNAIPAYPMDGGRVLRALLWRLSGNQTRATVIAARAGSGFGWLLVGLGALLVVQTGDPRGLWWCFIGLFIRYAARASCRYMLAQSRLSTSRASDLSERHMPAAAPGLTLERFMGGLARHYSAARFPVLDSRRRLLGTVSTESARRVPRSDWSARSVAECMEPITADSVLPADLPAPAAVRRMRERHDTTMWVTREDRLEGILTPLTLNAFLNGDLPRRQLSLEELRAFGGQVDDSSAATGVDRKKW